MKSPRFFRVVINNSMKIIIFVCNIIFFAFFESASRHLVYSCFRCP